MNNNEALEYYNNVLFMAKQILKSLGFKLINEGYYSDDYYGDKFIYEDIVIKRMYNDIIIDIDNKNVFYFDKNKNKITYEPGNWPKVIEILYENIPNFLNEEREKEFNNKKKDEEIKELKPYIDICSDIYEENEGIYFYLKASLKEKGIKIDRVQDYYQTYSNIQGTYDDHRFYKFVLYYNDEKVFECEDKKSDGLINIYRKMSMEQYLNTIKLGNWIPIFKEEVRNAKVKYDNRLNEIVNDIADKRSKELLKRFK